MANPSTECNTGIISWAMTLRTTMANDPGRQTLHDQIQTNGHLFLDEYLASILAGPKHDPIIELVKTPGRRKDVPKKTRAATAAANKAKAAIMLSFENDDFDKENVAPPSKAMPINDFHKKLLQAKEIDSRDAVFGSEKRSNISVQFSSTPLPAKKVTVVESMSYEGTKVLESDNDDEMAVVERIVTPPHVKNSSSSTQGSMALQAVNTESSHSPTPSSPNVVKDLSMIAEDDETAEHSRRSIDLPKPSLTTTRKSLDIVMGGASSHSTTVKQPPLRPPPNLNMMAIMDIEDMTIGFAASTPGSTATFHSVNLDTPDADDADFLREPDNDPVPHHSPSPPPRTAETEVSNSQAITESHNGPFKPVDEHASSPKAPARKPGVPHFPTIGAPSPLRKSMRAPREPSLGTSHVAPIGAKSNMTRSSWLVKAREAKAVEDNVKKMRTFGSMQNIPGQSTYSTTIGNKRKSEVLSEAGPGAEEESGRTHKFSKVSEVEVVHEKHTLDVATPITVEIEQPMSLALPEISDQFTDEEVVGDGSEGMINRLKKTVEGFSARVGKSMGKSLGGAAASALVAEARAAAEAKIAERHAEVDGKPQSAVEAIGRSSIPRQATHADLQPEPEGPSPVFSVAPQPRLSGRRSEADRRLSVSELVTEYEVKGKSTESERVFRPPPADVAQPGTTAKHDSLADTSTSTTPPDSPPKTRAPIFTLPPRKSSEAPAFSRPLSTDKLAFTGLQPHMPLSAQSTFVSTQSSAFSDNIFDHEITSWVPSTQDTEFDDPVTSQFSQNKASVIPDAMTSEFMDAEDSWRLDEKLAEPWMPVLGLNTKDDSMTWSSAPTQSTRGDTGTLSRSAFEQPIPEEESAPAPPSGSQQETEEAEEEIGDMDIEEDFDYAHQIRLVPSAAQSTTSLVSSQQSHSRTDSQTSNSTSQSGFLSTASRLMSSVLGGSKKNKPEPVKSLQLAAAVAKKQQEEAEKKATRLKEMEARRQQIQQKKAEEEKLREEKKLKDESDRRKREREDLTEKKILKQSGKKLEEDASKKRKAGESEKKTEFSKPMAKEIKKDVVVPFKTSKPASNASQGSSMQPSGLSKSLKQSSSSVTLNASVKVVSSLESKIMAAPSINPAAKGKGKGKAIDDGLSEQPTLAVQAQMQARLQAQIKLQKAEQQAVPSEAIELPDINSEYSDSDDEDRVRTFDPPEWAQSPELRVTLESMSKMNPDDIFGAIKPLKMEELFKTRSSRFRSRTSSANWAGTDELTAHEEKEYARRMGYSK